VTCRPGNESVLLKRKPILTQPPLPPDVALRARAAAAGVTPVGLRPPFVTPAAAHSHPDCRWILTLIDARQILVVEDDYEVREAAVATLRDLGYHVLEANDAKSALAIIENGAQIDLLFTDVVMPGSLRSPEMARLAKARLPNLAVLFTSGYTQNAIVHGGKLDAGVELLSKPYSREALANRIQRALTKSSS